MNRALRCLVHDEEQAEAAKRKRLLHVLKKRQAARDEATSKASEDGVGSTGVTASTATIDAYGEDQEEEEEEAEEAGEKKDPIEQQELLASDTAHWVCVEDSQQAVCLALNRRHSLLAVGEKDGRLSIWDNTTIRVITRELDPTTIVVPEEAVAPASHAAEPSVVGGDGSEEAVGLERVAKRSKHGGEAEGDGKEDEDMVEEEEEYSGEDGSATNEDGSVDATEDIENIEGSADNDDGSFQADDDGDGNGDEEDDEVEDGEEDAVVEEEGDAEMEDMQLVEEGASVNEDGDAGGDGATENESQRAISTTLAPNMSAVANEVDGALAATTVREQKQELVHGLGLSIDELKIVKHSLKHVVCCAWSCDSRLLFAGCEEKSNRRGRLCVWDVSLAYLLATFSFDAAINAVSAHPCDPDLVIICWFNSLPIELNIRTGKRRTLNVPIANDTLTVTLPSNSRHPSLIVCVRYGSSARFLYCATSKSTVSVLDAVTLQPLATQLLPILIQYVELAVNLDESALVFTSSKGIHEYAIALPASDASNQTECALIETRMYATGAVRAPWALCCFSRDAQYVVGMPIVRHRHVGESGLYTWHRGSGRVQHNLGVKDGVNGVVWDHRRDAILVASCVGALHVLEEEFTTTWPGTMYPAGFRLITDNEADMEPLELELKKQEQVQEINGDEDKNKEEMVAPETDQPVVPDAKPVRIDIFTIHEQHDPFEEYLHPVVNELKCLPSIPLATQAMRGHHLQHQHRDFHVERHFGLGQSVFEPLKYGVKKPTSSSSRSRKSNSKSRSRTKSSSKSSSKSRSKSKTKSTSTAQAGPVKPVAAPPVSASRSSARNRNKKRRR